MTAKAPTKRPRDPNQLAKRVVDLATATEEQTPSVASEKNAAAVELGRLGGLKGGAARSEKLSPARKREIAALAARKRWGRD